MKRSNLLSKRAAWPAVVALACGAAVSHAGWNPFTPGSSVEVDSQSGQLAIADFNGDGRGDILVNHPLGGRAALLVGDGHGAFPVKERSVLKFGYDPASLAAGDVDSDGRPDLAIASREDSAAHVHILLNSGGTFHEVNQPRLKSTAANPKSWKPSIALVDVNGDKRLDAVYYDGRQPFVEISYGDGRGQFAPGQTVEVSKGYNVYALATGDLNGDGRLDAAMSCAQADGDEPARLAVLIGDEQGKLVAAPELAAELPAGARVKTICDVDGDGRADVVFTHGIQLTALVQSTKGKLTPSSGSPFDMGHEAFAIAAVHAGYENNDVLVAATVDSFEVLYAHDGQMGRACNSPCPAGPGAYQVAQGDLNGDGKDDVVTNSFEGNMLSLLLSN